MHVKCILHTNWKILKDIERHWKIIKFRIRFSSQSLACQANALKADELLEATGISQPIHTDYQIISDFRFIIFICFWRIWLLLLQLAWPKGHRCARRYRMSRCNDAVTAADHFGPRGFRCKASYRSYQSSYFAQIYQEVILRLHVDKGRRLVFRLEVVNIVTPLETFYTHNFACAGVGNVMTFVSTQVRTGAWIYLQGHAPRGGTNVALSCSCNVYYYIDVYCWLRACCSHNPESQYWICRTNATYIAIIHWQF